MVLALTTYVKEIMQSTFHMRTHACLCLKILFMGAKLASGNVVHICLFSLKTRRYQIQIAIRMHCKLFFCCKLSFIIILVKSYMYAGMHYCHLYTILSCKPVPTYLQRRTSNQRTYSPVNAHLVSGPTLSIKTRFA